MILAIIQSLPTHPDKVVRTDTFAKFQHICGLLEQQSYLAAHAACHATMNGFSGTLAKDADIHDDESLKTALEAIFKEGPFDALVIPGLTDSDKQKLVCDTCANHVTDFKFRLFLDPERRSNVHDIVSQQLTLPRFASFCWPWVSTLTPGRRTAEALPPSALAAPLALHASDHLRGVHELDAISPSDIERLHESGVQVFIKKTVNRRPLIGIRTTLEATAPAQLDNNQFVEVALPNACETTDPLQAKLDQKEAAIEAMILEQVNAKCDALLSTGPLNNERLWRSLERTATAILMDAKMRGLITHYHVRCDEETASWGTPTTPVVEIVIAFAKRVKQLKLVSKKY